MFFFQTMRGAVLIKLFTAVVMLPRLFFKYFLFFRSVRCVYRPAVEILGLHNFYCEKFNSIKESPVASSIIT